MERGTRRRAGTVAFHSNTRLEEVGEKLGAEEVLDMVDRRHRYGCVLGSLGLLSVSAACCNSCVQDAVRRHEMNLLAFQGHNCALVRASQGRHRQYACLLGCADCRPLHSLFPAFGRTRGRDLGHRSHLGSLDWIRDHLRRNLSR